jgi:hypothetical protein
MPIGDGLGVVLEVVARERECPKCGIVYIEGAERCETCAACEVPLVDRRVTSHRFICPECNTEGYAPGDHGGKVRCKECRGEFEVQGVIPIKAKKKKKKTVKPPNPAEEVPFLPEETECESKTMQIPVEAKPEPEGKSKKKKKEKEPVLQLSLGV